MSKKLIKRYLTEEEDRLLTSLKGAVDEEIITEEFTDFVIRLVKSNWVKGVIELKLDIKPGQTLDDWLRSKGEYVDHDDDSMDDEVPDEIIMTKFI